MPHRHFRWYSGRGGLRRTAARDFEICIDATDPERLRPFWRAALDYVDQPTKEGGIDLADPDGVRPAIWLQRGAGAPAHPARLA